MRNDVRLSFQLIESLTDVPDLVTPLGVIHQITVSDNGAVHDGVGCIPRCLDVVMGEMLEQPARQVVFQLHVRGIVKLPEGELVDAIGDQRIELYVTPHLLGILLPFRSVDERHDGKDGGFDFDLAFRSDDFDTRTSADLQRGNEIGPFHGVALPL
jgi:hypothetical protein